jgi:hypothetical protein
MCLKCLACHAKRGVIEKDVMRLQTKVIVLLGLFVTSTGKSRDIDVGRRKRKLSNIAQTTIIIFITSINT